MRATAFIHIYIYRHQKGHPTALGPIMNNDIGYGTLNYIAKKHIIIVWECENDCCLKLLKCV